MSLKCRQKRITQQAPGIACNINTIMRRALETGMLPNRNLDPIYADFTGIESFQDAKIKIQEAKEAFMTLPARTRLRFGNDPQELIKFCEIPENLPEAIELGLVQKPEEVPPVVKPDEKAGVNTTGGVKDEKPAVTPAVKAQ